MSMLHRLVSVLVSTEEAEPLILEAEKAHGCECSAAVTSSITSHDESASFPIVSDGQLAFNRTDPSGWVREAS